MINCPSCGADVTGKKFCSGCGHQVQAIQSGNVQSTACPECGGAVNPGAAFCMHCGASLRPQQVQPATRPCPACQAPVDSSSAFCTTCGHAMQGPVAAASPSLICSACGHQNTAGMRFCGSCGASLSAPAAPQYQQSYGQPQYQPPSQPYVQSQYQQSYGQPQYSNQGGYQQQPMSAQGPLVLRCPTCMAMSPVGTPNCRGCQTSLMNIVPTPANMAAPGQQGGGFLQGNAGKYLMGALGGAGVVLGGEMLFNGLENSIENRGEGDMGFGQNYRHHHRREGEGLLGEVGRLADDIGL